jgi:hypothetical protein
MGPEHWASQVRPEQVVPPGANVVPDAVGRLQALLDERAAAFADVAFGTSEGIDLRLGRRGLQSDEAASFLRALDAGLLAIDATGGVVVAGCRPKPGGGRYALFAANRYGGDLHVSLNLEYVIQLGAACELVSFHGWPADAVEVEVGQFDVHGHGDDRVVLAMEAKARIDGPDSLQSLWRSFVEFASGDAPPEPHDNHSRKYVELLRLSETGPVVLWMVAAQARWVVLTHRDGDRITFEPFDTVDHDRVRGSTGALRSHAPKARVVADVEHAVATAALTELDGQQRCYEFPWGDEADLNRFMTQLRAHLHKAGLTHSRAWKWRALSGGQPMSPSGRTTGLELRFSYYAGRTPQV